MEGSRVSPDGFAFIADCRRVIAFPTIGNADQALVTKMAGGNIKPLRIGHGVSFCLLESIGNGI